nr:MAG TPA: hypothetical protein [Bacteriophage sp.]
MKYRAGDKVKVRSDLKCEEYYGGVPFTSEMNKFKGMEFTIARVNNGGDYKVLETPYTFANEMLEPVEEMSAEEAIRTFGEFCDDTACWHCPIKEIDREHTCADIKINHPKEIVKIIKQWKADHEKKPIETEFIYIVRIIEDKKCVHEEEMVGESEDEAQERVLKKYCEDHKGKFYAVAERICRVKE